MFIRSIATMLTAVICVSAAQANDPTQEQREQAFSERMSDTVMVGSFTVDGQNPGISLKEERYEISRVQKSSGNVWVFVARVKYMKFDATLPIPVPVEWAGDTPVITLTDARIPGLGEGFSCRVIFHRNRYAGTWQHGEIGGHMFGRIQKRVDTTADHSRANHNVSPAE